MGRGLEVCEFAAGLSTASKVARYGEKKNFYIPHTYSSALMYPVPRYVYVGKCTRASSPKKQRRPIDEIAPKKQKMYLVPRYVYVGTYVPGLLPPPKI